MANKKDLVEAHAYNRRRLVTAFVSGAPGGREAEPAKPWGPIVAGLVLGGMVVGAAAVSGVIRPSVKAGWDSNSLVVVRKTGAQYVAIDRVLYPVANVASARLILPAENYKVVFVPESKIAKARLGTAFGIDKAPDAIPDPRKLISDWVSCVRAAPKTSDDLPAGTSLRIGKEPSADPATGQGAILRVGKQMNVVIGTRRYPVAKADEANVIAALGLVRATEIAVTAAWAGQIIEGRPLAPLTLTNRGATLKATSGLPATVKFGDIVSLRAEPNTLYLATNNGLLLLNTGQVAMYRGLGNGPARNVSLDGTKAITKIPPAGLERTEEWPLDPSVPYIGTSIACVKLTASPTRNPKTELAVGRRGVFVNPSPDNPIVVDSGAGALVTSAENGPIFMVDATGTAYRLGTEGERTRLGLGQQAPSLVPAAWILSLRQGVPLEFARLGVAGRRP